VIDASVRTSDLADVNLVAKARAGDKQMCRSGKKRAAMNNTAEASRGGIVSVGGKMHHASWLEVIILAVAVFGTTALWAWAGGLGSDVPRHRTAMVVMIAVLAYGFLTGFDPSPLIRSNY
jgi:hypothetical protein